VAPGPSSDHLPPRATADGTHRRLLEVALETFGDRGFNGVSVRELAKAAGIQPSSMYTHLASKEALLLELMLLGHEEHCAQVTEAVACVDPEDQPARIAAWVWAHVGFHLRYPLLARVANRELHALSPDAAAQVLAVRKTAENLMTDIIRAGATEGAFVVDEPWLAAAMIGGMGIRVAEWWDPALGFAPETVRAAYRDGALRLLGVTPRSPKTPRASRTRRSGPR
jgi:AcrR family transcriptional regulator